MKNLRIITILILLLPGSASAIEIDPCPVLKLQADQAYDDYREALMTYSHYLDVRLFNESICDQMYEDYVQALGEYNAKYNRYYNTCSAGGDDVTASVRAGPSDCGIR